MCQLSAGSALGLWYMALYMADTCCVSVPYGEQVMEIL